MPGVTVTATSPALIGVQTQVTNENGVVSVPRGPARNLRAHVRASGFNSVKREGIDIALGFTANINAELAVATLQETVTVSGAVAGD